MMVHLVWLEYPSGTRNVVAVYEDHEAACRRVQEERKNASASLSTLFWVSSRTVVAKDPPESADK